MSNCRSCGARIVWEETNEGGYIPMNVNGTCHFDTCPQRNQWRNKEKKKYYDSSHDYTKPKPLEDSKQTRLIN